MDQADAVPDVELSLESAVDSLLTPETPRDEQGRFAKTEEPVAEEATSEAEEATEAPAEEPAEEEELSWDQVRDVKLKVPMKADGKEWVEELTLEQLRAERMMQSDYQRKTQELARQRSEAQEAARQAVRQEQARFAQELQALEAMVESLVAPHLQNVDLNQLAQDDPATWARVFQQRQQIDQAKQAVRSKLQQQTEQQRQEMQVKQQEAIRESLTKLTDPSSKLHIDSFEAKVPALRDFAVKAYDLTEQEVASIADPRFVKVLHDAMQWRELQGKKPEVEKRVTQAPKALKPTSRPDPKATQSAAKQALRQKINSGAGSLNDAVALLMN